MLFIIIMCGRALPHALTISSKALFRYFHADSNTFICRSLDSCDFSFIAGPSARRILCLRRPLTGALRFEAITSCIVFCFFFFPSCGGGGRFNRFITAFVVLKRWNGGGEEEPLGRLEIGDFDRNENHYH